MACLIVTSHAGRATDVSASDRLSVARGLSVMERAGIARSTDKGAKKAFSNAKGD